MARPYTAPSVRGHIRTRMGWNVLLLFSISGPTRTCPMARSYFYFFTLLPPPDLRDRIGAIGDSIGEMRSRILYHQLHMTLVAIAELSRRNRGIADWASAVLASHQLRAFTFALSRLVIQPGIARLEPVGKQPELRKLRATVADHLADAGMPAVWSPNFNPHVTLGRDPLFSERRFIDPLFWRADRISLVESWRGETHHEILKTWDLLPPIQGSFDFG